MTPRWRLPDEHGKKRRADAAPQAHVTLLGADEKVGFHLAGEVAARAEHQLRLVLGLFKILRAGLYVDNQAGVRSLKNQEMGNGAITKLS